MYNIKEIAHWQIHIHTYTHTTHTHNHHPCVKRHSHDILNRRIEGVSGGCGADQGKVSQVGARLQLHLAILERRHIGLENRHVKRRLLRRHGHPGQ